MKTENRLKINPNIFGKMFQYVEKKKFSDIKEAQKNALIKVLKNKNIPYQEFVVNRQNEETLGELISYFILETILLGKLLNTNPFDQPGVEQVKILTRRYLS